MTSLSMCSNIIDPRLLEDIRAGSCVAFVGAGFSAAAGLPSWPCLLRTLAAAIPAGAANDAQRTLDRLLDAQTGVSNRELEMAAQLLFDALGAERCRALLRDALKKEPLPDVMQLRLKHLFGIPFRAIVTTNFDPLIAGVPPDPAAYRRLLRAPRYSPWREAIARAALGLRSAAPTADAPDRPVIQLHGTLNDEETIVFTRAQYRRRLYANPAYLTALRALLATSSVLFLGYSLKDAYLTSCGPSSWRPCKAGTCGVAMATPPDPSPGPCSRTFRTWRGPTTKNTRGSASWPTARPMKAGTTAGLIGCWRRSTPRPTRSTASANS